MKNFKTSFLLFSLLIMSNSSFAQKELVATIVKNYFNAIGGEEKAIQVHTFSSESSSSLDGKEILFVQKSMLPNLFYTSMEYDGYLVSENIFDGKKGVSVQQDIEKKFSKNEQKRHKKNRSIFPEFDYIKTAKYIGIEKAEGEDCHVLEIENAKVYYSITSGLKLKGISLQEKEGIVFEQKLYFSKYIEIEGILFPSHLKMSAGKQTIEFQTLTIFINRGVSNKDFKKSS